MTTLILGQFCPFHNAHLTLIRGVKSARRRVKIGLLAAKNDPYPASLRMSWLNATTGIDVAKIDIDDFHAPYAHPISLPPCEEIAGSNPAVVKLAKSHNKNHFIWDPMREAMPMESHVIRNNIADNWHALPKPVRTHFQKRITFVGPESVGKSFFAREMAHKFGGPHVPEYGRPYEKYREAGDYSGRELAQLARRHRGFREALAEEAGPILFEDTDELMTAVWSEMLLGRTTKLVEAQIQRPDLYILLGADAPWEADTLRYFAKTELRQAFYDKIKAKLDAYNMPYIVAAGNFDERRAIIEAAISDMRLDGLQKSSAS